MSVCVCVLYVDTHALVFVYECVYVRTFDCANVFVCARVCLYVWMCVRTCHNIMFVSG